MPSCKDQSDRKACEGTKPGPCHWTKSGPRARGERCFTAGEYAKIMAQSAALSRKEAGASAVKSEKQELFGTMVATRYSKQLMAKPSMANIQKRKASPSFSKGRAWLEPVRQTSPYRSPKKSPRKSPKRNAAGRISIAEFKKRSKAYYAKPARKSAGRYTP